MDWLMSYLTGEMFVSGPCLKQFRGQGASSEVKGCLIPATPTGNRVTVWRNLPPSPVLRPQKAASSPFYKVTLAPFRGNNIQSQCGDKWGTLACLLFMEHLRLLFSSRAPLVLLKKAKKDPLSKCNIYILMQEPNKKPQPVRILPHLPKETQPAFHTFFFPFCLGACGSKQLQQSEN